MAAAVSLSSQPFESLFSRPLAMGPSAAAPRHLAVGDKNSSLSVLDASPMEPRAPGSYSTNLAKAMSLCAIEDSDTRGSGSDQAMALTQDPQQCMPGPIAAAAAPAGRPPLAGNSATSSFRGVQIPKRLTLELSQTYSQELKDLMLCTPDFATPVEQQFNAVYDPAAVHALGDDASRSPAPSPLRLQKRHRSFTDRDTDSMSQLSQPSQSQSRSQGEPSTCSKAYSGHARPPVPKPRRRHEPPVIRNPYLTPGTDENHVYHANHHKLEVPPRVSRFSWDYKIEKELGHGNFSTVYRAVHRQSGKVYAIKKSKRPIMSVADKNMWLAEIQALAAVEGHPNIVTYYDSWTENAAEYNTGEYILIKLELCGESLGQGPRTAMKEADLLEVVRQMASALKHIHEMGLVHLDLKPENIYRSSRQGVYKLGDFGLATAKDGSGRVLEGDARYLAPELLRSNHEALDKADMFALGITLYELAIGSTLPSGGERYQALRNGQLMMMPHVSMRLQGLIKKLMSADPKMRPSADAVLKMPLLNGGSTSSSQLSIPSPRMD